MNFWQIGLSFLLYPLFQRLIAPVLSLEPWFSFAPYIAFWLMLPYEWRAEITLLLSALFGLVMDTAFPPHGLHTFCGLVLWALRHFWLSVLFETQDEKIPLLEMRPTEWVLYALPLAILYMLLYFMLQQVSLASFIKGILSGAYSFLGTWVIFALLKKPHARAL